MMTPICRSPNYYRASKKFQAARKRYIKALSDQVGGQGSNIRYVHALNVHTNERRFMTYETFKKLDSEAWVSCKMETEVWAAEVFLKGWARKSGHSLNINEM